MFWIHFAILHPVLAAAPHSGLHISWLHPPSDSIRWQRHVPRTDASTREVELELPKWKEGKFLAGHLEIPGDTCVEADGDDGDGPEST